MVEELVENDAQRLRVRQFLLDHVVVRPTSRRCHSTSWWRESVRRTGLETRVGVTGHPVAETDPRRLDRIVTNLILNAHRHGATPVEVTVDGTTIVVRDHGPGFSPELLAHGPQRFRTESAERGHGHGLGLGLTIAPGQAHVIGAHLTLANTTPHGTVATLELPRQADPPAVRPTAGRAAGPLLLLRGCSSGCVRPRTAPFRSPARSCCTADRNAPVRLRTPGRTLGKHVGGNPLTSSNLVSSAIALTGQYVEGPRSLLRGPSTLFPLRATCLPVGVRSARPWGRVLRRGTGPAPLGGHSADPLPEFAAGECVQPLQDAQRGRVSGRADVCGGPVPHRVRRPPWRCRGRPGR
ncbi:HAMP domain-containing sensor histidine kinase [Streptomyces sp. NBC_01768]|uniref:HAMP domain-containing sensor histidine kinase n=1 Tax=Streptomyces sp. NBC_01768 TaxID=2975938 RepID=UPI002DD82EE9|nr:HAMP domain-containing sensor histidine kinase [Streptomyces sp. NBC_01768]